MDEPKKPPPAAATTPADISAQLDKPPRVCAIEVGIDPSGRVALHISDVGPDGKPLDRGLSVQLPAHVARSTALGLYAAAGAVEAKAEGKGAKEVVH